MTGVHLLLFFFVPLLNTRHCIMTDRPENQRPSKIPRAAVPEPGSTEKEGRILNFVEFYCGVGGWSMALEAALKSIALPDDDDVVSLRCVAALDHSDLCTKVYRHNKRSEEDADPTTKNIEKLTLAQVQKWNAAIWAMSPPCQPHTRQHANQDADLEDPRSKSFLYLCHLLETMTEESLPRLIFLENVVGFETSNSCRRFRKVLASRKYKAGHFQLSPTQVGIPNDRPRYFCVAARIDDDSKEKDSKLLEHLKLESSDDLEDCKVQTQLGELKILPIMKSPSIDAPKIASFLDPSNNDNMDLRIPDKVLNSNAAWCFDIVTPQDSRSACFTSAYGKFVKGTGSAVYFGKYTNDDPSFKLVPPDEREFEQDWSNGLDLKNGMRYFAGGEMARLMDYREGFAFPKDVTLKQQWKLLGNSLNVRVAGRLCELGLRMIV